MVVTTGRAACGVAGSPAAGAGSAPRSGEHPPPQHPPWGRDTPPHRGGDGFHPYFNGRKASGDQCLWDRVDKAQETRLAVHASAPDDCLLVRHWVLLGEKSIPKETHWALGTRCLPQEWLDGCGTWAVRGVGGGG